MGVEAPVIISAVVLLVSIGAWLGIFLGLNLPEIRTNTQFIPSNCTTLWSKVVPYRYCYKTCSGCSSCSGSSQGCSTILSDDKALDRYDVSAAALEKFTASDCCNGYYCCSQCCQTCTSCHTSCSCSRRLGLIVENVTHETHLLNADTGLVDHYQTPQAFEFDPEMEWESSVSLLKPRATSHSSWQVEASPDETPSEDEWLVPIEEKSRELKTCSRSCHRVCRTYKCNCYCCRSVSNRHCSTSCRKNYETQVHMNIEEYKKDKNYLTTRFDDFGSSQQNAITFLAKGRFNNNTISMCWLDPDWTPATTIDSSQLVYEDEMGYSWWKWLLLAIPSIPILAALCACSFVPINNKYEDSPEKRNSVMAFVWGGILFPFGFFLPMYTLGQFTPSGVNVLFVLMTTSIAIFTAPLWYVVLKKKMNPLLVSGSSWMFDPPLDSKTKQTIFFLLAIGWFGPVGLLWPIIGVLVSSAGMQALGGVVILGDIALFLVIYPSYAVNKQRSSPSARRLSDSRPDTRGTSSISHPIVEPVPIAEAIQPATTTPIMAQPVPAEATAWAAPVAGPTSMPAMPSVSPFAPTMGVPVMPTIVSLESLVEQLRSSYTAAQMKKSLNDLTRFCANTIITMPQKQNLAQVAISKVGKRLFLRG